MKVWNVPIEAIDMRYTKQWQAEFPLALSAAGLDVRTIAPQMQEYGTIKQGQFLDCVGTNVYKTAQLAQLLEMIRTGMVKDGDVIFLHDIWFPGIEQLFYIRDTVGPKFKIIGILHAGVYDPADYLNQCFGDKRWGRTFETMVTNEMDCIFMSCFWHREMAAHNIKDFPHLKVSISSLPVFVPDHLNIALHSVEDYLDGWKDRKQSVIFPHRCAQEKQPQLFGALEGTNASISVAYEFDFIKTQQLKLVKEDYFNVLAGSMFTVSFALQETFGIAMQEATLLGSIPLVPNRLAYADYFSSQFMYGDRNNSFNLSGCDSEQDLLDCTKLYEIFRRKILVNSQERETLLRNVHAQATILQEASERAIPVMIADIRALLAQ